MKPERIGLMSSKSFDFDFGEVMQEREGVMADSGLSDIAAAFTDSEAWRAECEARHCLNFYDLKERREYLALVEKHRGQAGRKSLEAAILLEWQKRKAA